MSWLPPSVIANLVGTAILAFTYFYLYLQDKKKYLGIWAIAWSVYFLRYVFMLLIVLGEKNAALMICNQTASLGSGMLLLVGSFHFIHKKSPWYLIPIFISGVCWIFISVLMELPFFIMSLPTFTLLAIIYIVMGTVFIKTSFSQKTERRVVGIIFIIWGLHKLDYPFLRPIEWFAPWGYILGAVFAMIAAIGLLMVYFKKTRDELSDSEKQLQSIYNTSDNIAFVVTDLAGEKTKILDINPGAENIFKCTRGEVIGQRASIFHPEDAVKRFPQRQADLINGKGFSAETVLIRKTGQSFPALYTLHPRFDSEGHIIGTLEVIVDISQRLLLKDEMRLQSEIIDRMSEGVYLVRKEGQIIYANPKFEEMFGYETGELVGEWATITQKKPRATMQQITDYLEKNGVWHGEIENIKKDGTPFWSYASVISFHHSQHGDLVVAVHLDITEKKLTQEKKEELESQLRHAHKMEAVGTLSGGIAHEFNNILGIILGNAELAMDNTPKSNPNFEFLNEIKAASLRGKNIVRQLLSFSRKDSQQKQALTISDTINESIAFLRSSIPSSIEFDTHIAQNCYTIMGNKTQIHQVIINLCNNAAQSMEENGGKLSIDVENKTLREKLVSLDHFIDPGNYICLKISDTGHGIPEDIIEHIFDPFYTTKSVDKGSGMGLAVVHGIMKAHNGIIKIQSNVNQGTISECYFPAFVEEDITGEKSEDIETGKETIMFVDDESQLVQTGQRILERLGYNVFSHTNPLTALDFFQSNYRKIDLVITDMTMPRMTGDKLIKELSAINPDVKTIICTGYSSRINEKGALEIGADGFIMKPFKLSFLSKTIREVLDQ